MKRWAQDLPFQLKNAVQNVLVVSGSLTDTQNHAIMECVKFYQCQPFAHKFTLVFKVTI